MLDALILTGGRARRLGGVDKAGIVVGGRTLLERVTAAAAGAGAAQIVVVGPEQGGGPVAAVAAGLTRVTAPAVAVLGADLPFLTPAAIGALRAALGSGAAMAIDDAGRDQPLCAVWRAPALRRALDDLGTPEGAAMHRLVAACPDVVRVRLAGDPPPWFDCDAPDDLARARRWAGEAPGPPPG